MIPVYQKLNFLTLPQTWCGGLITSIFKSGGRNGPPNYRGICVSSCLGRHILFYCKPKVSRACQLAKCISQISNWLLTKQTNRGPCPHTANIDTYSCTYAQNRLDFFKVVRFSFPVPVWEQAPTRWKSSKPNLQVSPRIDKCVRYHQEKVYACFVDFRKAFDSVWQSLLARGLRVFLSPKKPRKTRSS